MPAQIAGPGRNHIWFTEVALECTDESPWPTATQHPTMYWTDGPAICADSPDEALQYVRCNIRQWPWDLRDRSELGRVIEVRVYRGAYGYRVLEQAS